MRPELPGKAAPPRDRPGREPGELPVLSLPKERVVWLAAHAPFLALALLLATLAWVLMLASMAQIPQPQVVRGVVSSEPGPGTDGEPWPEDEHTLRVDVGGASIQELQPGLAAVVADNQGTSLRGRVTGVTDVPGGCGGAVPCRRLRIRLDGARPAGLTASEVEVRLAVASRSMLTWLLESVSQ